MDNKPWDGMEGCSGSKQGFRALGGPAPNWGGLDSINTIQYGEDEVMRLARLTLMDIKGQDKEFSDRHYGILKNTIAKIGSQVKKDVQYHGAFTKSVEMFGDQYFASKIYEKTMRIIHLTKGNESSFESLEDSLEDCMGYCMLALAEIRSKKNTGDSNGNS